MAAKKTTKPKKKGRPSKKDIFPDALFECLYALGKTDDEVAKLIGITQQTINNWKKAHPSFFESLKDWKKQADEKVERSLYERACGYSHPDTKAQFVQDKEGYGRWEYAELTKHYPPDPTSMIFWLKNRQPDKWRDKQDLAIDASMKVISHDPIKKPKTAGTE